MATTNWNQSYSDISTVVCRFFLNGNCRYGEMCRYSHATETVNHENAAIRQSEKRNSDNDNNNNHSTIVTAATSNLRNFIDAPEFIPSKFQSKYEPAVSDDNQNEESDNAEFQDAIDHSPMLQVEGVEATMPPANATFSYAQIVSGGTYMNENHDIYPNVMDSSVNYQPMPFVDVNAATTLCPYLNVAFGEDGTVYCPYGDRCAYVHGDRCSICNSYCLHPTDEEKRKAHETVGLCSTTFLVVLLISFLFAQECMKILEKDMEHSFAVARSKDKTCGICFEVITEKADREHRFGILPNCNHIFCLQCIRKWRQAKNFDSTITRACPECRVTSNYVCPSLYWVDTKEEKDKLLSEYKTALNQQNCKYFKQVNFCTTDQRKKNQQ